LLLPPHVTLPYIEPHNFSIYAQYTIQIENRDHIRHYLQQNQIPTAVHYPVPMHKQPLLAKQPFPKAGFPISEQVAEKVLSLPFHPYLTEESIVKITSAIKQALI
jgi:UDP-2-acetamido-2-deoxy-ribo-hexuluronate aminotransferase